MIHRIVVFLACVAGGILERASGGGAAIFPCRRSPLGISRVAKPRVKFNSTLHQSSHGFATRVHGFASKTKALAREIPPATQAIVFHSSCLYQKECFPIRASCRYCKLVKELHTGKRNLHWFPRYDITKFFKSQ